MAPGYLHMAGALCYPQLGAESSDLAVLAGGSPTEKALTVISCKGLFSLAPRDGLEPPT